MTREAATGVAAWHRRKPTMTPRNRTQGDRVDYYAILPLTTPLVVNPDVRSKSLDVRSRPHAYIAYRKETPGVGSITYLTDTGYTTADVRGGFI
jgi:hypothetical protein